MPYCTALYSLPEEETLAPWVRWPPWARLMPRMVSPACSSARYTALLAEEPECGWTLA
ncbi:hypothetical protein D3C84_915440 [compost metagenome]